MTLFNQDFLIAEKDKNFTGKSDWLAEVKEASGRLNVYTTKSFAGGIDANSSKCTLERFISEIVNCWGVEVVAVARMEFCGLGENEGLGEF